MKNATKWSSSNISIENLRCRILDVLEDAFEYVGVVAPHGAAHRWRESLDCPAGVAPRSAVRMDGLVASRSGQPTRARLQPPRSARPRPAVSPYPSLRHAFGNGAERVQSFHERPIFPDEIVRVWQPAGRFPRLWSGRAITQRSAPIVLILDVFSTGKILLAVLRYPPHRIDGVRLLRLQNRTSPTCVGISLAIDGAPR